MRVGVSSFAFGWAVGCSHPPFGALNVLEFAAQHDLDCVQLGDNLAVHAMPDDEIDRLLNECRQTGLALELGARGLSESHLAAYVELCRGCDASVLRFVSDAPGYAPTTADLIALLRNAEPALAQSKVTLGLENHDRLRCADLRAIVDAIGSPWVGICLDTANSLGAGEGLATVLETLGPVAVNLHVKDVAISRVPHQMGFCIEGRPLGRGQLDITAAIDAAQAGGRCLSVILEAWTPHAVNIDETIARERASAEESIATLKRLLNRRRPRRT